MENNGGLKTLTKHLPAVLGACPVNVHGGPLADGPASSASSASSTPLTFIDVGAGIYSGTRGHEDFAELDAMADPHTIRTRYCCLRSSETEASCTRELPRLT